MFGLDLNDPYIFSTLTMSIIVFVIGVYLLRYKVASTSKLKHYRISCRLMALSFFIVSIFSFISLIPFAGMGEQPVDIQTDLALSYTLMIASFQAFIGISSLVTLLNPHYLSRSIIMKHLVPIILVSGLLIYATFCSTRLQLNKIIIGSIVLYCGQLVYYAYIFMVEYKNYKLRALNFYSDDEEYRIRWIKRVLFFGFALGIYVLVGVFYDTLNNIIFTIVCTFVYIYIAIEYINYPSRFFAQNSIPPMDFDDQALEDLMILEEPKFDFIPQLEEWINNKGYIKQGINLQEMAFFLGTNQRYLSVYINDHYKQNFRLWISNLRMQEAQNLLINNPSLPIDQVSDRLGIAVRSSFHRQFLAATGETPANFRKLNLQEN